MSAEQVGLYYRHIFPWDRLGAFFDSVPFRQVSWKFIYLGDENKWSKWHTFPSVQHLRAHVLDSYSGFRKPIATINYGHTNPSMERFLTFDVDLNDYASVRNMVCSCGSEKIACAACWDTFIVSCAIPVMKRVLTDIWGFPPEDIFWFFSGRRGLHVHVRGKRALRMTAQQRARVLQSFKANVKIADICWPVFEKHLEKLNRHDHSSIYDIFCRYNYMTEGYFGGFDQLAQCCIYLKEHTTRAQWANWKEQVCQEMFAPKFDVAVTEQVTHACKIPFTLHQVTLNVCEEVGETYKTFNVRNYLF